MKDTPNSLRQALAGQRRDDSHPDPDLLSALVEDTLGQRERESVFAHLATCTRCREVVNVSTAAAPVEASQQAVLTAPPRKTLGFRFAWLASAATIAIVATVVVIHESAKQNPSESVRSTTPTQQTAQATQEPTPAPYAANESVQPKVVPSVQPPAPEGEQRQLTAKSRSGVAPQSVRTPEIKTQSTPRQDSREVITEQATPLQEPAHTNANVFVGNGVISTEKVSGGTEGGVGAAGSGSGAAPGPARGTVYMAKVAPSQNADQRAMAPAAAFGGPIPLKKAAALPSATQQHWRIDNSGHLQRSNAQGQWESLLDSEPVRFRVVSILGNDVWAGAEKLRLYHSSDSGATWTIANLPPKNAQEQSITHIHFEDAQVGRVESDSGIVWTTNDGGLTWK